MSHETIAENLAMMKKVYSNDEKLGDTTIFQNENHKLWIRCESNLGSVLFFPKTWSDWIRLHTDHKIEREELDTLRKILKAKINFCPIFKNNFVRIFNFS